MPARRVVTGRSQEPRKRFAEELRKLRTERGESLRRLGEVVGWDWSLFSKMEKGETLGGPEVVQALDTYYGTPRLLLALWELAVGDPTQFKEQYRRYMTLEAEAISLWHYAPHVMPGLLQTEAYARTLMGWGGGFEGDELTRQVEARLGRRALLEGANAPTFRTILPETVLRTPLPVRAEWQEQLEYLVMVGDRRNVTIQVVLHSAGLYDLANTDVTFLKPTDGRTVAWVETSYSGEVVEETGAVDRLQHRYDLVRDLALSPGRLTEVHHADVGGSIVRAVDLSSVIWRKSSYSNADGGNCLEVSDDLLADASWRKSSYSNPDGGECLEVAHGLPLVPVRDSKNPTGPALLFGAPAWAAFVAGVRNGTRVA